MVQAQEQEKKWYTVDEFIAANPGMFGKNALYDALRQNRVPSVKVGRKILIPANALEQMLSNNNASE